MADRYPIALVGGLPREIPSTDRVKGDASIMSVTETGGVPKAMADAFAGKLPTGGTIQQTISTGEQHPWNLTNSDRSVYQYGTPNGAGVWDTKDGPLWTYSNDTKIFAIKGSEAWTKGNFDPGNYAPIVSPTFGGTPNFEQAVFGQQTDAPYIYSYNGNSVAIRVGPSSSYSYISFDGTSIRYNSNLVWHAGNFNPSNYANLYASNIFVAGQIQSFRTSGNLVAYGSGGASLEVRSDGSATGAAFVLFNRSGIYATRFGLNENNEFTFGGFLENTQFRFLTEKTLTLFPTQAPIKVSPAIFDQTTPALSVNANGGGMGLGIFANSTSTGAAKFYAGEGVAYNRQDAQAGGAVGQGRIHAPHNLLWTDRIDNGTSDGSDGKPSNGINTVSLMLMEHVCGGGTGVRETLRINTIYDTVDLPQNVNTNYVSLRTRVMAVVGARGTDRPAGDTGFTGGKGAFFSQNPEAIVGPNAKNLLEIAISEANVGIMPGGSSRILYGYSVVRAAGCTVQGDVVDAAFSTGGMSNAAPFKDQWLISDLHGSSACDPNGTIMRVGLYGSTPITVKTVFDFANLNYTNFIAAPGIDIRHSVVAFTDGNMTWIVPGLPRSDPHSGGQWWVDANGFVKMSLQ